MLRPVKIPGVSLHVPMPRLLPLTIATMAVLLGVKSVELVRAAVPPSAADAAPAPPAAAKPEGDTPPPQATPASATAPAGNTETPAPDMAKPDMAKPDMPKPDMAKPEAGKPEAGKPEGGKPEMAKAETAAPAPAAANPAAAAVAPPVEPPISQSERDLLLNLRKRREELDAREAAIRQHEGLLAAAEARLATRVAELGGLQKRLESLETARKEHDEANWRGLVKLYESMKPKDAATIFNDLDLPVLLPVLDRMKEAKAAPVLAAMSPDRARLVTAELAQMRAAANTVPPAAAAAVGAAPTTPPPGKPAGG